MRNMCSAHDERQGEEWNARTTERHVVTFCFELLYVARSFTFPAAARRVSWWSVDEKSFVVPPDHRIGTVVRERYRIVRLLGEGGMGAVYEGEHLLIRRRVAIKFLHAQYARTPAAMTRFRREALAATSIGNPHVVEVTDMDQAEDGSPFMVLEFLEGSNLAEEVADFGPMPLVRALHVMKQLCSALTDVHKKGIIHRDLKPENLFLVKRGDDPDFLKILDFGISKFTTSQDGLSVNLTNTGSAVGSVFFMSPEQARGAADVDLRADIYALGGVLYFLLTGKPVFSGDSLTHMLMQIVSDPPPPLRLVRHDVPEGVEACVMRMLEKDRARRFQDTASVWAALEPYAQASAEAPAFDSVPPSSAKFARYSGSTTPGTPVPASHAAGPEPALAEEAPNLPTSTLNRRVRTLSLTLPVLIVALGAAIFFVARAKHEPAPQAVAPASAVQATQPPAKAEPSTVRLTLRTLPLEAELFVNGERVANPYDARIPRSSAPEHVEARLLGYEPRARELVLDRDQDLTLELAAQAKPEPAQPLSEAKPRRRGRAPANEGREATLAVEGEPRSAAQAEPSAPSQVSPEPAPTPPAAESKARDIKRIRL
jgi:serine/threonine-protein kinase